MNAFNKLPGFVVTPPGQERTVLRNLPRIFLLGTLLLGLTSLFARLLINDASGMEIANLVDTVDIYVISLVILHWLVVLTVAIGAFIVLVMKGPAYVADAYPLQDYEKPDDFKQASSQDRR